MKRVCLLIIAVIGMMFLNSCTDSTESLIENNKTYENSLFLIDKEDIQEPEDRQD